MRNRHTSKIQKISIPHHPKTIIMDPKPWNDSDALVDTVSNESNSSTCFHLLRDFCSNTEKHWYLTPSEIEKIFKKDIMANGVEPGRIDPMVENVGTCGPDCLYAILNSTDNDSSRNRMWGQLHPCV